jgi:DNA-binding transcriptional regulator YhcF (GntR family)
MTITEEAPAQGASLEPSIEVKEIREADPIDPRIDRILTADEQWVFGCNQHEEGCDDVRFATYQVARGHQKLLHDEQDPVVVEKRMQSAQDRADRGREAAQNVATRLRARILAGEFGSRGQNLPSVERLATLLDSNVPTVNSAQGQLMLEGILASVIPAGVYIIKMPDAPAEGEPEAVEERQIIDEPEPEVPAQVVEEAINPSAQYASAIRDLAGELLKLADFVEQVRDTVTTEVTTELRAQLDRVTRERDAARARAEGLDARLSYEHKLLDDLRNHTPQKVVLPALG